MFPRFGSLVHTGVGQLVVHEGLSFEKALDLCIEFLKIANRDLGGSLPSQRIAFKDLIAVYINPRYEGKVVQSTTKHSDRGRLQYSKATGEGQSFRMLYNIENNRPTNIYIQHRNTAYGTAR
jgi:hypothetical protein